MLKIPWAERNTFIARSSVLYIEELSLRELAREDEGKSNGDGRLKKKEELNGSFLISGAFSYYYIPLGGVFSTPSSAYPAPLLTSRGILWDDSWACVFYFFYLFGLILCLFTLLLACSSDFCTFFVWKINFQSDGKRSLGVEHHSKRSEEIQENLF